MAVLSNTSLSLMLVAKRILKKPDEIKRISAVARKPSRNSKKNGAVNSYSLTLDNIRLLACAARAAQFSSRPPIIAAFTGLKDTLVKKIYSEVTGTNPPKGQLPGNPDFYTSSLQRHVESIWLLQAYQGMIHSEDSAVEKMECVLDIYSLYLKKFTSSVVSFDRFFILIRLSIHSSTLNIGICPSCDGSRLVHQHQYYDGKEKSCPACVLQRKATLSKDQLKK